jgi:hypothetical protein
MSWGACHGILDGGLGHSGPLLGSSESMRGGTLITKPCQQPRVLNSRTMYSGMKFLTAFSLN